MSSPTWEWRRNYRVWEANRKVFLYPENWLEPEERLPSRTQFALREVADAARAAPTQALLTSARSTMAILAGRAVAANLDRDLYRVDLRQVVSKFIGETEKNLDLVFAGVEKLEAVLLFDEAEALFGKRPDAGGDDRYVSAEISHLLKRLEAYHGLTILATDWRASQVAELRRRIRLIVEVPG